VRLVRVGGGWGRVGLGEGVLGDHLWRVFRLSLVLYPVSVVILLSTRTFISRKV